MSKPQWDSAMVELQRDMAKLKDQLDAAMDAQHRVIELERTVVPLRDAISWIAQTVHRAHHEGPLETCTLNTCVHARDVLRGKRTV